MSKSSMRKAARKNSAQGGRHTPASGAKRSSLVAPVDTVMRRRALYPIDTYQEICADSPNMDNSFAGYQKYIYELVDAVGVDLVRFPEVFIVIFDMDDYKEWAALDGVAIDSAASRKRYVSELGIDDMVQVCVAEEVLALAEIDSLEMLLISTVATKSSGTPFDEGRFLQIMEQVSMVEEQLFEFLEDAVVDHAIITYSAAGLVDGVEAMQTGKLYVGRDEDMGACMSPIYEDLLDSVLSLGVVHSAGLMVRCCVEEEHDGPDPGAQILYGWNVSAAGLKGMSEAELFNASCTGPGGDLMPPEEGVTYASADETKYPVEPDDLGDPDSWLADS